MIEVGRGGSGEVFLAQRSMVTNGGERLCRVVHNCTHRIGQARLCQQRQVLVAPFTFIAMHKTAYGNLCTLCETVFGSELRVRCRLSAISGIG